jgi:hypothetical protein
MPIRHQYVNDDKPLCGQCGRAENDRVHLPVPEPTPPKRRRRCYSCGEWRYDVKTRENPYAAEIWNESVIAPYCDGCIEDMLGDI